MKIEEKRRITIGERKQHKTSIEHEREYFNFHYDDGHGG